MRFLLKAVCCMLHLVYVQAVDTSSFRLDVTFTGYACSGTDVGIRSSRLECAVANSIMTDCYRFFYNSVSLQCTCVTQTMHTTPSSCTLDTNVVCYSKAGMLTIASLLTHFKSVVVLHLYSVFKGLDTSKG